jgi:hypothetical protein
MALTKILNGEVVQMTPEEEAQLRLDWEEGAQQDFIKGINSLRARRNELLAASDWINQPDASPTNVEEWKAYRQELRDMMDGITELKNIQFPTDPNGNTEVWYGE